MKMKVRNTFSMTECHTLSLCVWPSGLCNQTHMQQDAMKVQNTFGMRTRTVWPSQHLNYDSDSNISPTQPNVINAAGHAGPWLSTVPGHLQLHLLQSPKWYLLNHLSSTPETSRKNGPRTGEVHHAGLRLDKSIVARSIDSGHPQISQNILASAYRCDGMFHPSWYRANLMAFPGVRFRTTW